MKDPYTPPKADLATKHKTATRHNKPSLLLLFVYGFVFSYIITFLTVPLIATIYKSFKLEWRHYISIFKVLSFGIPIVSIPFLIIMVIYLNGSRTIGRTKSNLLYYLHYGVASSLLSFILLVIFFEIISQPISARRVNEIMVMTLAPGFLTGLFLSWYWEKKASD